MDLLNLVFLLIFVVQIFFNYGYAQNTLISTKAIYYMNNKPIKCFSLTWLPFGVQKANCQKVDNVFNKSIIETRINEAVAKCDGFVETPEERYEFDDYFDSATLHQISRMYSQNKDICNDLTEEINLEAFWQKLTAGDRSKTFGQTMAGLNNHLKESEFPFSTRIDLQHYIYNRKFGRESTNNEQQMNSSELCTDRYGRKYPPPEGLGGKCVVFQHEYNNSDGKQVVEFFMPIEKRDMVQRISQYPSSHIIRTNSTILNRLLPEDNEDQFNETGCAILQNNIENNHDMFFHCVYDPNQSSIFSAKEGNEYECPKNEHVLLYSNFEERLPDTVYTLRPVDSKYFEFGAECYFSIEFIKLPEEDKPWNNTYAPFAMNVTFMGSNDKNCQSLNLVNSFEDDYETKLRETMKDLCPWDNDNSTTLCFKLPSSRTMLNFADLYVKLITTKVFDHCYYQSPASKYGCYVIVDPLMQAVYRLPSSWIEELESNKLIATSNKWSKKGSAHAFVYFTSELKKSCYEKLQKMTKSPIENKSMEQVKQYFFANTKSFVKKCDDNSCGGYFESQSYVHEMNRYHLNNPMNCYQGTRDKSIDNVVTTSAWTFFCSIGLSIYYEGGVKLRRYNFTEVLPQNYPIKPQECWLPAQFSEAFKNPDIEAEKIPACQHDFSTQSVTCCCRTSKDPCNQVEMVEEYYKIATSDAKEMKQRIDFGCRFETAEVTSETHETCAAKRVRTDREMRCYGVFEVPATAKDEQVKPKLIKENCYWPHPQYHDEYSIFCSKQFFDIDDLVENKCITLFINDFTSSSSIDKKSDRRMILCCNAGVYPEKRKSILARSVVVL